MKSVGELREGMATSVSKVMCNQGLIASRQEANQLTGLPTSGSSS
jgi:hypothetical protein